MTTPSFLPYFTDVDLSKCTDCSLKVSVGVSSKITDVLKMKLGITADPTTVLLATWRTVPHFRLPDKVSYFLS